MRENKAEITKKLEELINLTRMGKVELEYVKEGDLYCEEVHIRAIDDSGTIYYHSVANVTFDSGVALIRDVMRHDYFN